MPQFNMNPCPKFVVVHAGSRDRYQLPLALAEKDLLECFITDACAARDPIGRLVSKCSSMVSRHQPGFDPARILNDPRACLYFAIELFGRRLLKSDFIINQTQIRKDRALSLRAADEALKRDATLFAMSYYAGPAFRKLRAAGKSGLLFQIHPHPKELKRLYEEEIELTPLARDSLMAEKEMQLSPERLDELASEPALAQRIMVASSFTKSTLTAQGVDASKISVCPYGVDFGAGDERPHGTRRPGPLRIAFLGSIIQRKGLSYLLEAVSRFPQHVVQLTFYTRSIPDARLLQSYQAPNISVVERLSDQQLADALRDSDVFALPSIAEGFAHALAEAMSCGLPAIATPNSMAADFIEDGVNGFIVPIRSADAIEEKIAWCLDHTASLREMGEQAALKIHQYTWARFREGVRSFLNRNVSPLA